MVKVGECDHDWEIWKQGVRIIIPELHVRIIEQTFEDDTGDISSLVTCAEEEGYQRKHHLVTKILAKKEHSKHYFDGYQAEDRHEPFAQFEHFSKLLDITRKLVDKLAWEDIGPEPILALAERDLQLDLLWLVAVSLEKVESMSEDWGTALDTIVQPFCTKSLLV